jgi:hypothetical protein
MSSTSTTWTTDTNTKSGSVTTYTNTVSSLKLIGAEGEDAVLKLFADEGDDNADQWRIVSSSSTNKLNFMSLSSGSWSNVLDLFGSGTAASQYLAIQTGNKLYLDGGSSTYLQESADGVVDFYADGVQMLQLLEGTTDYVWLPVDATKLALGAGKDLNIYTSSDDAYIENITSDKDIIFKVNDGGVATEVMRIDGDVSKAGIGTTSPQKKLHVASGTTNQVATFRSSDDTAEIEIGDDGDYIYVGVSDDGGASAVGVGYIGFNQGENANNLNIDANGKVGIGTTDPAVTLDVGAADSGSIGVTGKICRLSQDLSTVYDATDMATVGGLIMSNHDDTSNRTAVGTVFVHRSSSSGAAGIISTSVAADRGDLRFVTRGSDGIADRVVIDTAGKVGIGDAAPACKLEVAGAMAGKVVTISTAGPTDNVDVSEAFVLKADTSSNNVTIGGLAGGVAGQVLHVAKMTSANTLTLEHSEGGGSQNILLCTNGDEAVVNYGGWTLVCNGSSWIAVSSPTGDADG